MRRRGPKIALAVLGLATLGTSVVPWTRTCQTVARQPKPFDLLGNRFCQTSLPWNSSMGTIAMLLAATLVLHETTTLLQGRAERAMSAFLLALATAAALVLGPAVSVAYDRGAFGGEHWSTSSHLGLWLALAFAAAICASATFRLRDHVRALPRRRLAAGPDEIGVPDTTTLILVPAAVLAFASYFLPWIDGGALDEALGMRSRGFVPMPAALAAVVLLAAVAAEIARIAGIRVNAHQGLGEWTALLSLYAALFSFLSFGVISWQAHADEGLGYSYGAWITVGSAAALLVGGVLRLTGQPQSS